MLAALGPRLANVALRALSLGSRFALLLVLAKLLPPSDVGVYGLFVATVSFSTLLIGGEYHAFAHRELVAADKDRWSFMLQHHVVAVALLYLLLLPVQLVLFWLDLLPRNLLAWFFALLILEHLAQEMNRLLIVIGRPLAATWILFIRMGAWVWPLLLVFWAIPGTRHLDSVFAAWLAGVAAATLAGALITWKEVAPWRTWPIDFDWIRRGFLVGALFLVSSLCFKALTTIDRYFVELLAGQDLLGIYVLYVGLAMAILQVLQPAVTAFLYPRIVGSYRKGDMETYGRLMRELAWSSIGLTFVLALAAALLSPYVLRWIGRPIYLEHIHLLWLLLAVPIAYAAGLAPHYGLYARGADVTILATHIAGTVVFIATVAIFAPHVRLEATALGLLAALTFITAAKFAGYRYRASPLAPTPPPGASENATVKHRPRT
jgi:O-antigen/teichoic acid export membrane protein